jgi:hypothetical protein
VQQTHKVTSNGDGGRERDRAQTPPYAL